MKTKLKDRLWDAVLILLFLAVMAASAYGIIRIMTKRTIKGIG